MTTTKLARLRHTEIVRLRRFGLTYRQISTQMAVNQATICRHMKGYCDCENGARAAVTSRQAQG